MELTQALVRELFDYDPEGFLVWKVDQPFQKTKGKIAGYVDRRGYAYVDISSNHYGLHRLIFLWHFGYFPQMVDHISRDHTDNRIENIRASTASQNGCNQRGRDNTSSKWKGVSFHKAKCNWRTYVSMNKKPHYLGSFENEADAAMVYNEVALVLHGEFVVLNDNRLNHIALVDTQDLKSLLSTNEEIHYVGIIGS